jgi:tetratricopeptide (TPR) repeat protein
VPRDWVPHLRERVDEVWVPTSAVRAGFVHSGVPADKVHVLPLGVDHQRFRPGLEPLPLPTDKRFRFLFVGGTIHRKGIDVLLRAFGRAFRRADDVCLVIKDMGVGTFYRGQTAEDAIAAFRADLDNPEVVYLDSPLSEEEMARLYCACDCLAAPYRGEGFGLPIAEAMSCGLPVLVTNHGAALDFCDELTAWLIPARVATAPDCRLGDLELAAPATLAEPDGDALVGLLRRIVDSPDECRRKVAAGRRRVEERLTWDHAASAVEGRLRALATGGPPAASVARPRVSLVMIVKDEEANLRACLASVRDLFDEIIVNDTGSTDRTVEIARSFGAKVIQTTWPDSFSQARNAALAHATGEWVFWLDADDLLDEDNREKLRALLANLPNANVAFSMKCRCQYGPDPSEVTVVDHVRLFRNEAAIRWRYRVHEQILPAVKDAGGRVLFADVTVTHTGYVDLDLRRRKLARDLRLLEMEFLEQPDDPFTLFNLGSVRREMGQPAEALPLLRRSLSGSHPNDSIVRKLFTLIAGCHVDLGDFPQALAVCVEGRAVCPDDAELLYLEGSLRLDLGDPLGAQAALRTLLGTTPAAHFASVKDGLRGHQGLHLLALACSRLGEANEAEALWRQALALRPDFSAAWRGLAELLTAQGRWSEVADVADALARLPGAQEQSALVRGTALMARGLFADARAVAEPALASHPASLPLRLLLGDALLRSGLDLERAELLFLEVLTREPDHPLARRCLDLLRRAG